MDKIVKVELISCRSACEFENDINASVNSLQDDGYRVEIQYQPNEGLFTALLIGKEDNHDQNT